MDEVIQSCDSRLIQLSAHDEALNEKIMVGPRITNAVADPGVSSLPAGTYVVPRCELGGI